MSICTVKFLHFPTLHFYKKTALELLCPHETAITIIAVYDNVHFLLKRDWIYILLLLSVEISTVHFNTNNSECYFSVSKTQKAAYILSRFVKKYNY